MYKFLRKYPLLWWFVGIFLVISLSFIVTTGYTGCNKIGCGLHIAESHMHDSLWHIGLSKLGFNQYPFINPLYDGGLLQGYNYGIDLIIAGFIKIGLDPFLVYFRILPAIAGLLFVYATLRFLMSSHGSKKLIYLQAFFIFFGNSYSYLATLYSQQTILGSTLRGFPVVTSIQPTTMFLNLQFSISLSLLLLLLVHIRSNHTYKYEFGYYFAMFFLLFGLKFYAGVVAGILLILLIIPQKKYLNIIGAALGSLAAYLLFYSSSNTTYPFVFAPFALTHLLIDDPLLFYNHNLTLARYFLYENGNGILSPRLVAIELLSIFFFALINFGPRLLSILSIGQRNTSHEKRVYSFVSLITFMIPIFFIQDGGWYNTMQFLYYGIFLASIATASFLNTYSNYSPHLGKLLIVISCISMLPNTFEQLRYPTLPDNFISQSDLDCLNRLKEAPIGVVHVNRPWAKRAIIPALAEKPMYYLDTDQLDLTQIKYEARLAEVRKYEGGSIRNIPADYYFIYKTEVASPDSIAALSKASNLAILCENSNIVIFANKE